MIAEPINGLRGKGASLWRILLDLFPTRERWRLSGVVALMALAAVFETIGVASILPFMALVVDPSAIDESQLLQRIAGWAGASSRDDVIMLFGGITIGIIALGNAIASFNVWIVQRYLAHTRARITSALFDGYTSQPYGFHVDRDGPSLVKIMGDSDLVQLTIIAPILNAGSRGLVGLGVLGLLFVRTPGLTAAIIVLIGGAYAIVYKVVQKKQRRWGREYEKRATEHARLLYETLGGIKELQALGREQTARDRQARAIEALTSAAANNSTIGQVPRYVLEAVAFGGIVALALALIVGADRPPGEVTPILALYAFAGFRLMPALQNVFAAAVGIRFYLPTAHSLHADYLQVAADPLTTPSEAAPPLSFKKSIRFEAVSFKYRNASSPALDGIDLTVKPFESIGIVGRTGAGKSTLADLLLGLYEPSTGTITVDGVPLTGGAIRSWRRMVGYVSQHVFLSNTSIRENIAFGLSPEQVDDSAVQRAATLAQAGDFIQNLPLGFDTIVGERGVKLSGGQRQRIGIARALYHDPAVLVFDEATSALDGLTEDALVQAVRSLSGDRTIVLIAHRMRTVEACDRIIVLDAGKILAQGTYEGLIDSSPVFRQMVNRPQMANAPDDRAAVDF